MNRRCPANVPRLADKFLTVWLGVFLLGGSAAAQTAASDKSGSAPQSASGDSASATDQNKPDQPVTDSEGTLNSAGGDSTDKSGKKDPASGMVKLRIEVTSEADKPVPNASVYVRFPQSGGFLHHDKLAELGLKTNQDGSVKVPEIPQGKILIQVIAQGWHTYGKWYDVDKNEELIKVKLDPPAHWY